MKAYLCRMAVGLVLMGPVVAVAQQPPAVDQALREMTSERVNHTSFTFDHDMLQSALGFMNDGSRRPMQLDSITIQNYRYHPPVFYIPESMHALVGAFDRAGWKHLVAQHTSPAESAEPHKNLTDMWLHFNGSNIDGVTVVLRGARQMTVIEVSGELRPLDLMHLGGHFGIPKVDPGAVMVPAPPGK